MKSIIILSLFALPALSFALPEKWDVDLAAQPQQVFTLQRPRGETYELEAVLNVSGKPFAPAITNACIYWQTNGMENLYWSAPASVSNNVLRAFWLPEMDPGATTVRGYIGDPGHIYAAAFQFRFIASPGPTPNVLPLPVPVIDFAKVRVLNPPWPGGGSEAETNLVRAVAGPMIADATNGIRSVDGAARPLPRYLHALDFFDSYPDEAAAYYRSRGNGKTDGGCSAVRDGGFLYRNFDYPFDYRAEFVVKMSAGTVPSASSPTGASTHRFASVGVAQVGTNLTETFVTSGKPSRCYKWLPGATVDGINENGVVAEINVVDGDPQTSGWHTTGDLHPLAAIRWILDNATNAQHGAEYIAANIRLPAGWTQNFHYMIADERETWIVENGSAHDVTDGVKVMTNFRLYPTHSTGEGQERYVALANGANITSQWWTLTYTADGYRASDLPGITGESLTQLFNYWENNPRESHRGESFGDKVWWQTVHTSIYDISNRVLSVAVQEQDDWYVFQVPSSGAKIDAYTKAATDAKLAGKLDSFGGFGYIGWWNSKILEISEGGLLVIQARNDPTEDVRVITNGGGREHGLSKKADRPSYHYGMAGNLASLTELGDLANSGIGTNDVKSVVDTYAAVSNAAMKAISAGYISETNGPFAAAVLAVQVASLSTNITAEVYIAATNACANLGIDPALIPGEGTIGTVGGIIAMLFAVVFWMRKKIFDNSGKVNDTFAGDLLQKQVAKDAVNDLIEDKIEDSTTSTSTTDALSANMGKELQDQIQNLKQRGRYLSIWNCTTGLAETEPTVNPYPYKAGDYFIVGTVGATNYRPNGAQYDKNAASTTPETATVLTNDTYYYDGTSWSLLHTPMPPVPTEYLKSATATDNNITVTKQDDTQVSLTVNYEYAVGTFGSSIASGEIRTITPIALTVPVTLNLGNSANESADCALWVDTSNLASDVTLLLSSNYNYYGDTGYQTMTKGKHILVTFLRLNATDVIVTKKEY